MYKNYWLRRKAIREDAMVTYPLIYGFKTPEKHAFKFVDGDASEKRWKRVEISSAMGGSLIIKDDKLLCGDWTI